MKKICIAVLLLLFMHAEAQITEGTVKYAMKVDGNQQDIAAQMLINTSVTIYFKKEKALMDMTTPAYHMRTLTDNTGVLMLMDAMGQKFYTRKSKEDIAKGKTPDPVISLTNETKKIAGFDCKKAFITVTGKSGTVVKMAIWATDKIRNVPGIGPVNAEALSKLKGMALEVEMEQGGIKTKMTATDISTKPLADVVFVISTNGFTERKTPGTPPAKK